MDRPQREENILISLGCVPDASGPTPPVQTPNGVGPGVPRAVALGAQGSNGLAVSIVRWTISRPGPWALAPHDSDGDYDATAGASPRLSGPSCWCSSPSPWRWGSGLRSSTSPT